MSDFLPRQKRCKWCAHGRIQTAVATGLPRAKQWRCKHPEQDYRTRAVYWPATGCPAFEREPGADDDYIELWSTELPLTNSEAA